MLKSIDINSLNKKYSIYIQKGLFDYSAKKINEIFHGEKIAIFTDDNVKNIYANKLVYDFEKLNYKVKLISVSVGERSKSIEQLQINYSELNEFQLTRSDLIIALGGGVVGDLAGFTAATYLRGISFVQIPTSLLAQIDSSIGGKVAINLSEGKNLVGNFYNPIMVLIDPDLLKSLEQRYLNDAMAEIIKYGCIYDKKLFDECANINNNEELFIKLENIIFRCCEIKAEIVSKDEFDNNERRILNFGHTIGHAVEKIFNFEKFTHGEAVAIGMYMITKKSEDLGLSISGTSEILKEVLKKYDLPYDFEEEKKSEIMDIILNDKKRSGSFINLVLIKDIGKGFLNKTEITKLHKFI